ncbi:MAG: MotA/TolQ/ExbB proton channel family protein [Deltaproteobacteria bacterium]|nr:MotA/TolQ/ExbB proton channel family protein [Deltaproteobacteria bacterium]
MTFNLVETLMTLTLFGAEWVLWLLLALSILSVGVILERGLFFFRIRNDFTSLSQKLSDLLSEEKWDEAIRFCEENPSVEAKVALWGLNRRNKGPKAMASSMEGCAAGEKNKLDRGLVILGTLGNNAPFIGLFGTVIGIIEAFHKLSSDPEGGASVVMGSISEALIATAVGLMVAIPAVIAFNAYNRNVRKHMSNIQSLIQMILSFQR